MEKRIIIRSIVGSPLNIALVVLVLLALISSGYWWMMAQPTPDETAQQITQQVEQTVIPTIPDPELTSSQAAEDASSEVDRGIDQDRLVDPSFAGADDDSASLPPEVVATSESVGVIDDHSQRVVITSEVVDALLENEPEQVDTSDIEQVVDDSRVEEPVVSEAPAQALITFSFGKDELNDFSPRSYTLQLAAVNNIAEAQKFLNRYDLGDSVYVYPTRRSGAEWFIITYDNYPTIQLARDAVEQLPESIQKLGPWAKSLNQVQREIARTN